MNYKAFKELIKDVPDDREVVLVHVTSINEYYSVGDFILDNGELALVLDEERLT